MSIKNLKISLRDEIRIADVLISSGIEQLYKKKPNGIANPHIFVALYNFSIAIERIQKVLIIVQMDIEDNCKVFDELIKKKESKLDNSCYSKCILNFKVFDEKNNETIKNCVSKIFDTLETFSRIHNLNKLHSKIKNITLTENENEVLVFLSAFYKNVRYDNYELFHNSNEFYNNYIEDLYFNEEGFLDKLEKIILSLSYKYFCKIKKDPLLKFEKENFIFSTIR